MNVIVHTDGGSRGNPGRAAVGAVLEECRCVNMSTCLENERKIIGEISKTIGETTNNVAEYTAVIEALKMITTNEELMHSGQHKSLTVQFFLDSSLVVNQLNGLFKIKDERLHGLYRLVLELLQMCKGKVTFAYIPREQNRHADMLVNRALDA